MIAFLVLNINTNQAAHNVVHLHSALSSAHLKSGNVAWLTANMQGFCSPICINERTQSHFQVLFYTKFVVCFVGIIFAGIILIIFF